MSELSDNTTLFGLPYFALEDDRPEPAPAVLGITTLQNGIDTLWGTGLKFGLFGLLLAGFSTFLAVLSQIDFKGGAFLLFVAGCALAHAGGSLWKIPARKAQLQSLELAWRALHPQIASAVRNDFLFRNNTHPQSALEHVGLNPDEFVQAAASPYFMQAFHIALEQLYTALGDTMRAYDYPQQEKVVRQIVKTDETLQKAVALVVQMEMSPHYVRHNFAHD